MKLGEYLPAFARVISLEVKRLLHRMVMFLGALSDSETPGYQKHDIDFLIGDLIKPARIRNTDRVPITNNNNERQENNCLREDNDVSIDSSNDFSPVFVRCYVM